MDINHIVKVIYPYFIILYLIDGVIYLRKYHLIFVSQTGNRFQLKSSGFHIAGFLPFSKAFLTHNTPVHLTSRGLYISTNQYAPAELLLKNTDYAFLRYQDIEELSADEKLLKINNKLVRMHSAKYVKYIRDFIVKLKVLGSEEREKAILEFYFDVTNTEEIRSRLDSFNSSILWLRIFVAILFFYTFLALPVILYSQVGGYFDLYRLLLMMLITYCCVLIIEIVTYKKIYNRKIGETISVLIRTLLSPVSSLHAVNMLGRDLFWRFDYIALAAELLSLETFSKLVGKELYYADYLAEKVVDGGLLESWKLRNRYLVGILEEKGISKEDALESTKQEDESAARYCPLCGSGYRLNFKVCSDCGVDLKDCG